MTRMPQVGRFALVGVLATATHLAVGSGAIGAGVPPLTANPLAFVVAFAVSYAGHYGWTFADVAVPARRSLPRFRAVALAGLALNEAVLAALLMLGVLPMGAFVAAVALAAGSTYVLSRTWAFRPRGLSTCHR